MIVTTCDITRQPNSSSSHHKKQPLLPAMVIGHNTKTDMNDILIADGVQSVHDVIINGLTKVTI